MPTTSPSRLRDALAMWRGHPYADIEAHGFLDGEITRLTELRLAALEARIDADMRAGRHREVIAELDALTVEHPFRENLRALHMLALYRSGRQAEALRAFGHTRDVLVEGLGIDPSPELKDLERRILAQDRDLLALVGPTVQRRAVVVADIDDSGWHDPAEREIAFARRESELAAAADRDDGVKLAPKGTAGYAVFSRADPRRAGRPAGRQRADPGRGRLRRSGDARRRAGRAAARSGRPARRRRPSRPGPVVVHRPRRAHCRRRIGLGRASRLGASTSSVSTRESTSTNSSATGSARTSPSSSSIGCRRRSPSAVERSVPGYELRSVIGIGELGEVHRAYQPSVGREVAVRIFGPGMVGHPQFVRRFETASQRVTRVEHPHVVPLLDYWREPNRAVMVSRLMTGGHLGQRIPSGGLDTADALAIFETVASQASPRPTATGWCTGGSGPRTCCSTTRATPTSPTSASTRSAPGSSRFATDAYDAPERLGGALATPAADVYSLGVLLHHLLGGSPPPPDGTLPLGEGAVDRGRGQGDRPRPAAAPVSVDELVAELRDALAVRVDPTAAFVPTRNPYRGLEAFEQADADDFYGRERAVAEMVEVLEQRTSARRRRPVGDRQVVGGEGRPAARARRAARSPAPRRGW